MKLSRVGLDCDLLDGPIVVHMSEDILDTGIGLLESQIAHRDGHHEAIGNVFADLLPLIHPAMAFEYEAGNAEIDRDHLIGG